MKQVVAAGIVLSLAAFPGLAASPKVEAAIKTVKAVSADPGKLKIFCEMQKLLDAQGEKKPDPATNAKIDGYMNQLGNEFQAAWNTVEEIEEDSPDGQALGKALDDLSAKCG
jgi:hypothetical protein